ISSILEISDKIHRIASLVNDRTFLLKEDAIARSTTISIASKEELSIINKIIFLENELSQLKKRKREIKGDVCENVMKLLTKNRALRGLENYWNELGSELDRIMEDLEMAEQKQAILAEALDNASALEVHHLCS
ncbi:hypothetical protein A2U01_0044124, partial [Trifolium medium]|nr:hypothetical protein [Trifolium medium]